MAAVTVQEFVCCCMFALPESPSDGRITGLSKRQMRAAENNIMGALRGILGDKELANFGLHRFTPMHYQTTGASGNFISLIRCVGIHVTSGGPGGPTLQNHGLVGRTENMEGRNGRFSVFDTDHS